MIILKYTKYLKIKKKEYREKTLGYTWSDIKTSQQTKMNGYQKTIFLMDQYIWGISEHQRDNDVQIFFTF